MTLNLPKPLIDQIERAGILTYPNECCGILYGHDRDGQRLVETLEPVANDFEPHEQFHRFSISAAQLMQAEKTAAAHGQLVLGFYHSHPDHPARPSEYDREHAWPFYSYIIVAIAGGKAEAMTSWLLDEQTEQFESQVIVES